jgi:hypothetical protein
MQRHHFLLINLTLISGGCSVLSQSAAPEQTELHSLGRAVSLNRVHSGTGQFDPDATSVQPVDIKPGLHVALLKMDGDIADLEKPEGMSTALTQYAGTVVSVDAHQIILKDAVQIIEHRATQATPIVSKVPYVSRIFRNTGVAHQSRRIPESVTVPRTRIAAAYELSPSGMESLRMLRQSDEIGIDFDSN